MAKLNKKEVNLMQKRLTHILYNSSESTSIIWMGHTMQQWPIDLMYYQEIIYLVKPTVIIETGTGGGGTTLFLEDVCSMMKSKNIIDRYKILTVDINKPTTKFPDTIQFILGSSISKNTLDVIQDNIDANDTVLVLLDCDHSVGYVLRELDIYAQMVSIGSYIVVQDTALDINAPVQDGPTAAVDRFLLRNDNFIADDKYNRWILTQHPSGYLKRIK